MTHAARAIEESGKKSFEHSGECLYCSVRVTSALGGSNDVRVWEAYPAPTIPAEQHEVPEWPALWLVSLAAAAANEAAIHHRPTVSSEGVTDKANRINKALAQAPLLCSPTALPSYVFLKFSPFLFLLTLNFSSNFVSATFFFFRVTSFICVGLQLLSVLSLSVLLPGPRWTCWYAVGLSLLTGDEKELFRKRKKRPEPEDYRRPLRLLVERCRHQTNACLIFSQGGEWLESWKGKCFPGRQFKW